MMGCMSRLNGARRNNLSEQICEFEQSHDRRLPFRSQFLLQGIMTFKLAACLSILGLCPSSEAFSQERHKDTIYSESVAYWQKQCNDKADSDKLDESLRPTFMVECVAGAKLDTSLALKARDSK